MTRYYTLLTRAGAVEPWAPQFGDYDRATVVAERAEYRREHRASDIRIIVTDDTGAAIARAVAALNGPSQSLPGLNPEKIKCEMEDIRARQEELAKRKRGKTIAETVREAEATAEKIRAGEVDDYDQ